MKKLLQTFLFIFISLLLIGFFLMQNRYDSVEIRSKRIMETLIEQDLAELLTYCETADTSVESWYQSQLEKINVVGEGSYEILLSSPVYSEDNKTASLVAEILVGNRIILQLDLTLVERDGQWVLQLA